LNPQEEAIDLYRQSIESNPNMPEAHYNLASLMMNYYGVKPINSAEGRVAASASNGKKKLENMDLNQEVMDHLQISLRLRPNHKPTIDMINYLK
jgi:tetratricopeptide (TPR) repeat protein